MSRRTVLHTSGVALVSAALLTGAVQLEAVRERTFPSPTATPDELYVTSGAALRRMSVAYSALAADLYWIRAIQYYGGTKRRLADQPPRPEPPPALAAVDSDDYRELYPLLDVTTSLDPRFNIAYRFGAVFLAEPPPRGPGRPDLAIRLLEKGLRERPDKWEYMEDIGFVHYWYTRDFTQAAAWFEKAAAVAGAPWWMKSLAATTLAQGGDRQSSRLMWETIRQSAEVDWLRQDAERRLAQLRALDDIDALQKLVDRLAAREPSPTWADVARATNRRGVPVDPAGVPYELDGARVRLSPRSPLAPLPEEPPPVVGGPGTGKRQ